MPPFPPQTATAELRYESRDARYQCQDHEAQLHERAMTGGWPDAIPVTEPERSPVTGAGIFPLDLDGNAGTVPSGSSARPGDHGSLGIAPEEPGLIIVMASFIQDDTHRGITLNAAMTNNKAVHCNNRAMIGGNDFRALGRGRIGVLRWREYYEYHLHSGGNGNF